MNDSLSSLFEAMQGLRIPGGCDDCDAYQTTTTEEGAYVIRVHHDDSCPYYVGRLNRAERRRRGQST